METTYRSNSFFRVILILSLWVLFSIEGKAQLQEDFSTLNLQTTTFWQGDKDSFQISQSTAIPSEMRPGLQLNGKGTGQSFLAANPNLLNFDTIVWEFWAKISTSVTATNHARFYLLSKNSNLKTTDSAIFINLGENKKMLELLRKNGNKTDTLIRAFSLNKTTNVVRVKVKYSVLDGWELWADSVGEHNFVKFGSSPELCPNYPYVGIYCCYTSSNATKMYFDDISVKNIIKDTSKPFVEKIELKYPNSIYLYFSEEIDSVSAKILQNYEIEDIGNPLSVEYTPKKVCLSLPSISATNNYKLTVKGISDLFENEMLSQDFSFTYVCPQSLLLNEILFNSKTGGTTFVEIYNSSAIDIPLKNLCLSTYDKTKEQLKTMVALPADLVVKAGDYAVFTPDSATLVSQHTILYPEKIVKLSSFPAFLKTEGVAIIARNDSTIIDRFDYSEKMHFQFLQSKYGVSLERKFFDRPTQDSTNWASATEECGWATPTYKNSQFGGGSKFQINPNDIIINEVLFNPKEGGSTFVEIYNKTTHDIPLKYFCVALFDAAKGKPKSMCPIYTNDTLRANDYLVLTKDKAGITDFHTVPFPEKILQMESFPSLLKTEGSVVLALPDSTIIDRFDYSEKMHFQFLQSKYGVSLERKFFDRPTQDSTNWASATEECGWATPTYKNSQFGGGSKFQINPNDIIINEVLFNPKEGGSTFVEIYNKTAHDIPLKYFCVALFDAAKGKPKSMCPIYTNDTLRANDYLVLTKEKSGITGFYTVPFPEKILQVESFPSLLKTEGSVVLALSDSTIIDQFNYSEKMHFPLLKQVQGVSLERRYFEKETQQKDNWQSASQLAGWATPTYKNSQYQEHPYTEEIVTIEPKLFTPNNDGKDDLVNIYYKVEQSGLLANVTVYNAKGLKIKDLHRNTLLGLDGSFSWDGIDEQGRKCAIGFYVFLIELIDIENGNGQKFKKTVVLGG